MAATEDKSKVGAPAPQKTPAKAQWQTPVYEKLDLSEAETSGSNGPDSSGPS